mmetsp:Transcript_16615/g.62920  ORF Transcript_16615/g.62920 Transcript_16615/m.62920 type:complete len:323 (+) Transcript_16615:1120-2088(+)
MVAPGPRRERVPAGTAEPPAGCMVDSSTSGEGSVRSSADGLLTVMLPVAATEEASAARSPITKDRIDHFAAEPAAAEPASSTPALALVVGATSPTAGSMSDPVTGRRGRVNEAAGREPTAATVMDTVAEPMSSAAWATGPAPKTEMTSGARAASSLAEAGLVSVVGATLKARLSADSTGLVSAVESVAMAGPAAWAGSIRLRSSVPLASVTAGPAVGRFHAAAAARPAEIHGPCAAPPAAVLRSRAASVAVPPTTKAVAAAEPAGGAVTVRGKDPTDTDTCTGTPPEQSASDAASATTAVPSAVGVVMLTDAPGASGSWTPL